MSVNSKMTAIADEIRAVTGGTEPLTLDDMAENVPKVYEAGKKSEYDAFWDTYQQNGERTSYACGFAGTGWNEHTLKPKYDIKPTTAYGMFWYLDVGANIDLVKIAEEQGIEFDFSNCANFNYFSYASGVVRLGVIDTRSVNGFGQFVASNGTLHTIEKLILRDDGSQKIDNNTWFLPSNSTFRNITIEGKLGGSVRCVCANMTKASLTSFLTALYDGSEGKTLTLSKTAVNREFETAADLKDGVSSAEWKALVEAKPNWTISLV